MKTQTLCVVVWLAGAWAAGARAADAANESLQNGLLEEEVNRNLDAAIQAYQVAIDQFDEQRKVAGTAVFRLAECYRKLGRTNEAAGQYQRVVRDFADQTNLATLSRKELDRMPQFRQRLQQIVNRAEPDPNEARDRQRDLLKQELKLVEQQLTNIQLMASAGRASSGEVIAVEREVLSLKRQMAALDATVRQDLLTLLSPEGSASNEPAVADEEAQEIQRLKALKENSPDLLGARDSFGRSPLHYAVARDFPKAVSYLLDQQVNVDAGDRNGNTPLHLAIAEGRKTILEQLLARGANVNAKNQTGATPLHVAAAKGFKLIAETLLTKGAEVNAVAESAGSLYSNLQSLPNVQLTDVWIESGTPLHNALAQGYRNMVDLLLAHQADVNPPGEHDTPLSLAVRYGRADLVKLLLERGADLNAKGDLGNTALHWAVDRGSEEILGGLLRLKPDLELRNLQDLTPLQLAITVGQVKMAEALLQAGANPNVRFEGNGVASVSAPGGSKPLPRDNKTPLHWAVQWQLNSVVRVLLKAKADVNAVDASGRTPLHFAARAAGLVDPSSRSPSRDATPARAGALESVKLLLAAGADANAKDRDGGTALGYAVTNPDGPVVEALLKGGADPNLLSRGGSPLSSVIAHDDLEIARLFLAHKANVNIRGHGGNTPLHGAASVCDPEMVELLLSSGADPGARNDQGRVPLEVVDQDAMNKRRATAGETVELLRKAGEKKPVSP